MWPSKAQYQYPGNQPVVWTCGPQAQYQYPGNQPSVDMWPSKAQYQYPGNQPVVWNCGPPRHSTLPGQAAKASSGPSPPSSNMDKLRKALSGREANADQDEERGNIITQVGWPRLG
ncbi:hypothetical protein GWK47_023132 [Chionoecetes opilio]|uniref:Uncharacterized protein n=1 Tax=Chionoecetes opilio TaxID=41210 RepID=A0A8J5CDC0_CHIOP|nr:hypothetical protein GWK47_023132 [Chionoecetes opilio]